MHAGTFLGGAWGGVRVFVFGFLGFWVSGHPGDPRFPAGVLAVFDVLLWVNALRNNVSIARKGL